MPADVELATHDEYPSTSRRHSERQSNMSNDEQRPRATFTTTSEGTASDWAIIGAEFVRFASELPERVLAHLLLLSQGFNGFPVDRLTHSLQTATLAQEDGRDDEY